MQYKEHYHTVWNRDKQEWQFIVDENGNKIPSNLCICNALCSAECKCGAWNEYWDNYFELEGIY